MRHPLSVIGLLLVASSLLGIGCTKHVAANPPSPVVPAAAPTQPAAVPAITLGVEPAAIDRGQSATLRWTARNATSVRIDPQVGSVNNQGSRTISPDSSVTYTATAVGAGGTAVGVARITVRTPAAAPVRPTSAPARDSRVSIDQLFKQNVQPVFFDYDSSDIRVDQISQLTAGAAWLRQNPSVRFRIEGNADDRGSEEYNLALGDRRANRVKDFLIRQGVNAVRITIMSFGEERPVCREETESCYQQNRRAAFDVASTN